MAALFMLMLTPFSINLGSDGLSANYLYILTPIFFLIWKGSIIKPSKFWNQIIIIYSIVFILALVYQLSLLQFLDRRIISFMLFMSIFSYIFISITSAMISAFKLALVGVAFYMSVKSIIIYLSIPIEEVGFGAKDLVGTQRTGFIKIIAFWIVFLYNSNSIKLRLFKNLLALVIIIGLLLTYSRSSIVALFASGLVYIYTLRHSRQNMRVSKNSQSLVYACLFLPFLIILYYFFTGPLDFYKERLFSFVNSDGQKIFDLVNPEASEGYRIFILKKIIEFVAFNPFTGSGFLGVWILFDDHSGSSHNQYSDVMFRTGLIGFSIYLYLLYKIWKYLLNFDHSLLIGYSGVLVYGFFHETFKESQGAFILTFLIGMIAGSIQGPNSVRQIHWKK